MQNNSPEQYSALSNKLKSEVVKQFLKKVMKHAILSKRFKNLNEKKRTYLARHICAALNYSFKYDRVSSFRELIEIHRMMSITKEEVDAFNEVFIAKCFSKTLPEHSVQRRVMVRVGELIVDGFSDEIQNEEVLFFYRAISWGQDLGMLVSEIYIIF